VIGLLSAAALLGPPYEVPQPRLPVLAPLKPCYVTVRTGPDTFETETLKLAGSGFTPDALVDVVLDGAVVVSGLRADAEGVLPTGSLSSPPVLSGQRRFELTATEREAPERSASATARASELAVRVTPARARPAQRVRFRGRGFTGGGAVYAHYLRKGALRRTVRLADGAEGPCGRFDVRAPQFPFRPREGSWRVQIDQHPRLTGEGPLINLLIDVRRRPA
jgi:hypothetical protein